MRVVYIDSLVLLNFLLDYLVLLAAGRLTGEPLARGRLALGALLGALYAACLVWPGWPPLGHPLVRLGVGLLMVLLAYGAAQRLLRVYLLFLAVSAGLGGVVYALSYLHLGLDITDGVPAPTLDLKLLLLAAVGAYALLALVGRKMALHAPGELRRVEVTFRGQTVVLTALVDNGNTLTDPMTGKPVLVAEGARLAPLLPPEADCRHPSECFPRLSDPRQFQLLPYRAVGVDQGLLLALRADGVRVEGRETGSRLVALSPTPVSESGRYQALLYHG